MSDQGTSTAQEIAKELQADLLPPVTEQKLQRLRERTILDMCELEIVGTPEEITTAIGNHHLLKGRKQAFEELLDAHHAAMQAVSAN